MTKAVAKKNVWGGGGGGRGQTHALAMTIIASMETIIVIIIKKKNSLATVKCSLACGDQKREGKGSGDTTIPNQFKTRGKFMNI